jgi:hypothetical protein
LKIFDQRNICFNRVERPRNGAADQRARRKPYLVNDLKVCPKKTDELIYGVYLKSQPLQHYFRENEQSDSCRILARAVPFRMIAGLRTSETASPAHDGPIPIAPEIVRSLRLTCQDKAAKSAHGVMEIIDDILETGRLMMLIFG